MLLPKRERMRSGKGAMYPKGYIFDLDGTLVNSYGPISQSLNHTLRMFGKASIPKRRVRTMVGRGLEELMRKTVGEENIKEGVRIFRERYREIYLGNTFLLPDIKTTLEKLSRRGARMGVASNKPSYFSENILAHLEIGRYFKVVFGPEKVTHPKPHPEMIEAILAVLGLPPDEVLYVGDMVVDIETARNAGLRICSVLGGSDTRKALEAAKPDFLVGSFPEIAEIKFKKN
jgi:2-phosphoglycolate phosphatase